MDFFARQLRHVGVVHGDVHAFISKTWHHTENVAVTDTVFVNGFGFVAARYVMSSLQVPVPTTIVRAAPFLLAIRLARA